LGPGNVPKGKAAVSFNWDLENLPKGKAAVGFNWDLEILPKGKAAVSFNWDLEIITKRVHFWAISQQLLITLPFTVQA
jgi:hypothetical protein